MTEPVRVVMLWPDDLKASLQKRVGKRGLTKFVLETIEQRLALEKADICQTCSMEMPVVKRCWMCGNEKPVVAGS